MTTTLVILLAAVCMASQGVHAENCIAEEAVIRVKDKSPTITVFAELKDGESVPVSSVTGLTINCDNGVSSLCVRNECTVVDSNCMEFMFDETQDPIHIECSSAAK